MKVSGRHLYRRIRFLVRWKQVGKEMIGIAIVAVAAGQEVHPADGTLIVAVHRYERYKMRAMEAALRLH